MGRESKIPLRGKPGGFCFQENELYRVFQPIVGSAAVALYCNLTSMAFGYDPTIRFSRRSLAARSNMSRGTIARELAVLERTGMLRLRLCGGNLQSEGELVGLKGLAESLGAVYNKRAMSLLLPPEKQESLKAQVAELRRALQGKIRNEGRATMNHPLVAPETERDASGSLERRQRRAGETQIGVQQIKKERRQENSPTPTPSRCDASCEAQELSYEGESIGVSLSHARALFNGVMNDLKHHLVNPTMPRRKHLRDGYDDWRRFGFESLGVVEVSDAAGKIRLELCANDPEMSRAGLEKYRKTWRASLHRWFEHEVEIELQPVGAEGVGGEISRDIGF